MEKLLDNVMYIVYLRDASGKPVRTGRGVTTKSVQVSLITELTREDLPEGKESHILWTKNGEGKDIGFGVKK